MFHVVRKGDCFKESEDDYERLLVGLRDSIRPANALEEMLLRTWRSPSCSVVAAYRYLQRFLSRQKKIDLSE